MFDLHDLTSHLLESVVAGTILLALLCNYVGTRVNKGKALAWWEQVRPLLEKEFFSVGIPDASSPTGLDARGKDEFAGYASGRVGIRSADLKLMLAPRHLPTVWLMDAVTGFLFDQKDVGDRFTLTLTTADGADGERTHYDGCVFALVHKSSMQQWRKQRYDLSLTRTADHAALPPWMAVMSESSEITQALLPDLPGLQDQRGLYYLLASDLPAMAPSKLEEWRRQKRITVYAAMGRDDVALVRAAIALADALVRKGHFRQEVLRRLQTTREEEERRVRRLDEEEKRAELEKKKAAQRKEQKGHVAKLPAEEQRKALEKERERQQRRRQRVQK